MNYDTFVGSEKNTWGYKTSGEIIHDNCCLGSVVRCCDMKVRFLLDGNKQQFQLYLNDDNPVVLFKDLPSRVSFAVSLLHPQSKVFIETLAYL